MAQPHKHKDCIIAWANGAVIQLKHHDQWLDMEGDFIFYEKNHYRIKPEPKPDKISYGVIGYDGNEFHHTEGLWTNTEALPCIFGKYQYKTIAKIKIVIDGDDYTKVKSVEIIK